MKILVLILGANSLQYQSIIQNSLITWGSLKNENVEVYAYYGNNILKNYGENNESKIINRKLIIDTYDSNITFKTLLAFEYALNNIEFDYIVRPNASTYVRLDKLYEYLLNAPRVNYYAGDKQTIEGVTYPMGYFIIYSKDIIQKIVKNKFIINENQWADDWVIGKFLENSGTIMSDDIKPYLLIGKWPETELLEKMYNTSKEELEKYIFFRCKTEVPNKECERNDILKMNFIHKTLYPCQL